MDKTIEAGFYSAAYFTKAQQILNGRLTPVRMQVFQKDHAVLYGISEAVSILRGSARNGKYLTIKALKDGDKAEPWETVMTIEGDLGDFVHLESVYLGVLARGTRVATNMSRIVDAAGDKPVLFMGDRFDRYENQFSDGEAALIGGAAAICTPAMGYRNDVEAAGTMPHALIAAFGGDVVAACRAYADTFPGQPITALVDFNNDCVGDSLRCLASFGENLSAVRLDTSERMVDKSITDQYGGAANEVANLHGVNPTLVSNVRNALDANGGEHVKIVVSGGFNVEKINYFESTGVPVDMYGVGSSIIKNGPDFTADVIWPTGKVGRPERPNARLKEV
jgi:nicotinate phosphoribosyltransferase